MSLVFNEEYIDQLSSNINQENADVKIFNNISTYSSQIGIDSFRNIYLLDGKTGKSLTGLSSNEQLASGLDISTNIISSMNGETGKNVNNVSPYMDYAVPLKDGEIVKYIIYVRDTKEETNNVVENIFRIMMQAMVLGLVISLLFAILLSKTILAPIESLTQKAKKISSGDFEERIDVTGNDEIAVLTDNFNQMADELKTTLNAIQSEKDKVETILRYMTDGVIAFDKSGQIIHINPTARRLMNISARSFPTFEKLFQNLDITMTQASYLGHFESTERKMTINNTKLSIYFAPFKTNKKLRGLIAVIQDITKQEMLENSRREFVANVSHELRTPLTTVKSYAETLIDLSQDSAIDNDTLSSFLSIINNETDRMTRLVKDLLLLSQLDYGLKDMYKDYFSVGDLISDIVSRLQLYAKEKNQTMTYEPTNQLPEYYGNSDRIEQVITNIITNALKYTPEGGSIFISSMYMYDEIIIKVKDTGIGISEENLNHIFERFYRVDKARSRQMGGTGLGLAIAKEIVEAHGGSISIKSVPNFGTDVLITLPIKENDNI
jgi:two-component system sensor histidine kinase VicK